MSFGRSGDSRRGSQVSASIDDASSVATSLSGAPAQRNVPSYMQSTANRERSASKAARRGSTIGRGSVSSPGNGMGSSRRIQGPGDYEDEGLASSSPRERARTRSTAAPLESPSGGSRMRRRASAAKERTENTNITVAVRVRPLNEKELNEERLHLEGHPYDDPTTWQVENADIWETDHVQDEEMAAGGTRERHEQIKKQNRSSKRFTFNNVFTGESSNETVYDAMCPALVDGLLSGFNTTLLAYGQTSSGKTHTLMGTPTDPGLIILMIDDVFSKVVNAELSEHLIRISYFEIYNESFNDLLAFDDEDGPGAALDASERGRTGSTKYDPSKEGNKFERLPQEESNAKLRLRGSTKTGWNVEGIKERVVKDADEVVRLLAGGEKHRHFGATAMNDRSSRSHTVFRMIVESREAKPPHLAKSSVLNLVDLAGSESIKKTLATGTRQKEGAMINSSLLVLGKVIAVLSKNSAKDHIPYGDSALTKILATSLGGNAKTAIITCVSPAASNLVESRSSLLFASRAAKVQNNVSKNISEKNTKLDLYRAEIENLKEQLAESKTPHGDWESGDVVSEKRLKDLQALIIIGSEVARENRAAGQTIMMNLAAVSQGRRRLSSFVGEALDMQSLQNQMRKSISQEGSGADGGRRMTQKSLASLQQIADLKRMVNDELDDDSVATMDSDEQATAAGDARRLTGAMAPSEVSDVPKQALSLFHKYNYLSDDLNSTLWSMRATQKGAKTSTQVAQSVSKGAVSTDKRWVPLEEVDALEVKYSKHMADLVAKNQELFSLVEDMRTALDKHGAYAAPLAGANGEAAAVDSKARLQNFIQMSNETTGHSEKSKQELLGEVMSERQQLEITRALYLTDLHDVVANNERSKAAMLREQEKVMQRAETAEEELRRVEMDAVMDVAKMEVADQPEGSNFFVRTRWADLSSPVTSPHK